MQLVTKVSNGGVKVEQVTSLYASDADILVCPVCCQKKKQVNYPLQEFTYRFPYAYGAFRRALDDGKIGRGEPYLANVIGSEQKVLWFPVHHAYDAHYQEEWIAEGIEWIRVNGLHKAHSIAFPAMGYYEEDEIDPKATFRLVSRLNDTAKVVSFHVNY